jgi:uncharacterized protein
MPIINRYIKGQLESRLTTDPVVLIEGPRSVGKSTLLRELATKYQIHVLDLDEDETRLALEQDPGFFLSGPGPVLIDEYQKFPEVLQRIKAELNQRSDPGRFILAGSTNFLALPDGAQALTGRLGRLRVEPLSQAEIEGVSPAIIQQLVDLDWLRKMKLGATSRDSYFQRVLRGGFPIALQRTTPFTQNRWADDYIQVVLTRDIPDIAGVRNLAALGKVLHLMASRNGQVLNLEAIAEAAEISRLTAQNYVELLKSVFLGRELPAWGSTLGSRVTKRPKYHITDSLIAARLLRVTAEELGQRTPGTMTQFGSLLESFAVGEFRRLASFESRLQDFGHWRDSERAEVDLIVEDESGMVRAFEVKASTSLNAVDAKNLMKLRERLGGKFAGGAVLYLGKYAHPIDGNILALPLDALWAKPVSNN